MAKSTFIERDGKNMLFQLNIKNMALIRTLNIEFEEGLNVLTGETGAGKSIIIQAINIILGSHVSSDMVREGEDSLIAEGLFFVSAMEKEWINSINSDMKIINDDETMVIRREVNKRGRNKCWVNEGLVNLSVLQKIGKYLVDLHGQHNHQSLLDISTHIDLLDRFGGDNILKNRSNLFTAYRSWKEKKRILLEINIKKEENLKRIDFLKFQLNEISDAALSRNEDKILEEEEILLRNVEKVLGVMEKAIGILHEGGFEQFSVRDLINEVLSNMGEIAGLDPKIEQMRNNIKEVSYHLEDNVGEIINYKDKINLNQQRLKEVEERLNIINNLKSKYGNTISEISIYREKIYKELNAIDYNDEKVGQLREQVASLEQVISQLSIKISEKREKIAREIEKEVIKELDHLRMKNCRFKVSIIHHEDDNGINIGGKKYKIGPKGIDIIEFMISPNLGESLRSLAKIVSGGEISRIMLALKSILSEVDRIPTLIFDEIDSGVGARLGEVVAEKLRNISKKRQVICVTHLPQIACKSQRHFYIEKNVIKNSTWIKIREINGEHQVNEIARMLDGNQISEITIQHARKMLSR